MSKSESTSAPQFWLYSSVSPMENQFSSFGRGHCWHQQNQGAGRGGSWVQPQPCWDLRRALTLSGRDEEDNPPEKPWLWIRVEKGSRMASTGGEKASKMKIKTNIELENTSSPGV